MGTPSFACMNLQEEKELILKAQTDQKAFGQLYDEHYSKIFNYIVKRVLVIEIAQDIASEVFIKCFKNLWQFKWRNIALSSWLYRIAINEIANYYRKNATQIVSLDRLLEENGFELSLEENPRTELIKAQEELEQHQEFLKLQTQITKLPLHYQTVLTLRFFEKKKIQEISQILGKKEGTIKSLLSRGLEQLRKLVETQPL